MAFNISYVYSIKNRYSSQIKKIIEHTERFEKAAASAKNKVTRLSKALRDAGTQSRNLGSIMDESASGIVGSLERLAATIEKVERRMESMRRRAADLDDIADPIDEAGEKFDTFAGKVGKAGAKLKEIGGSLAAKITLPLAGAGLMAGKTSISMENAFTGLKKTITATPTQLAEIKKEFESLSTEIPVTAEELFGIGEAAGQLGIKTKNVLGFTKVIANLSATTNLVGEEGAKQLARFANVTGMAQEDFDRLGSTISHLGNNLATTEAEIVSMSLRLAGAGAATGISEAKIMGLSGALSSVGMSAEAGGSAFSRIILQMNDAVAGGGKELKAFAKVAGISSKKFAETFKKDASAGVLAFIDGLGKIKEEGGNVNQVLAGLDIKELVMKDALLRASSASEKFHEALVMAKQAWEDNEATANEAATKYATNSNQLKVLWNKIRLVAKEIGDVLVPVFVSLASKITPVIEKFRELSPKSKTLVVWFVMIAAAIPPILIFLGSMAVAVSAIIPLFAAGGTLAGIFSGALAGLGTVFGILTSPIGIIVGLVGYLIYKLATTKELIDPLIAEFKVLGTTLFEEGKKLYDFFTYLVGGESTLESTGNTLQSMGEMISSLFKGAIKTAMLVLAASISFVIKTIRMLIKTFGQLFTNVTLLPKLIKAAASGDFSFMGDMISATMEKNKRYFRDMKEISFDESLVPNAEAFMKGKSAETEVKRTVKTNNFVKTIERAKKAGPKAVPAPAALAAKQGTFAAPPVNLSAIPKPESMEEIMAKVKVGMPDPNVSMETLKKAQESAMNTASIEAKLAQVKASMGPQVNALTAPKAAGMAESMASLGGAMPFVAPQEIIVKQEGEIKGEIVVKALPGTSVEKTSMENKGANVRFAGLGGK